MKSESREILVNHTFQEYSSKILKPIELEFMLVPAVTVDS